MFAIKADRQNHRIRHSITGFLNVEAIQDMARAMNEAIVDIRRHCDWFDLVVDLSEARPAPREAGLTIDDMARNLSSLGVRKVAIISREGLTFLQAKRLMDRDDRYRMFDTESDAIAWLRERTS